MKVRFDKNALYQFYVTDKDSDMDELYYRFEKYFGKRDEWTIEDDSHKDLEERIYQEIWKPYRRGDYILQRYLNSGLATKIT